ncbi:MAG: hypothetical protein ACLGGZ_04385 [Alphaproteobacteria bacterium]
MNRLIVILSDPLRQRLRGESEESPSAERRSRRREILRFAQDDNNHI